MSLSKSDFPQLKWSLLAFGVSAIVGGAAIWSGAEYIDHTLKERQSAQKQVSEARTQFAAAQSDLENMSTYALEYTSLVNNKIIGGEQRLDWMEGLDKLRSEHHVMDLKYTIAPQHQYTPNPPLESGNFEINLSDVNLQMELLHEMQLIKFFQSLRTEMKGWFVIDHCSMERVGTSSVAENAKLGPQLKADCAGGWITLKNRSAP